MLRNQNLIPLSRQHQHALALCVRLNRALSVDEIDLIAWQEEIQLIFDQEIAIHFMVEEKELFPAPARSPELKELVDLLLTEHAALREYFHRAAARRLDLASLRDFAEKLAAHIRKEERELFEGMQRTMTADELDAVGAALDHALKDASASCAIPKSASPVQGAEPEYLRQLEGWKCEPQWVDRKLNFN